MPPNQQRQSTEYTLKHTNAKLWLRQTCLQEFLRVWLEKTLWG